MEAQKVVKLWSLHLDPTMPARDQFRNLLSALLELAVEGMEPVPDEEDDPYHGLDWREFEAALTFADKLAEAELASLVAKLSNKLLPV